MPVTRKPCRRPARCAVRALLFPAGAVTLVPDPNRREPAMLKRFALFLSAGAAFALAVYASADKPADEPKQLPIPEMKFNDVKEIAPGVFFRYSSISATDT